ncbi:MAG: LemA family protein [Candidatus Diapherotrites archaeon]|nr:LemA family protein [Candidatus Diapherotrites archaeon]
MERINILHVITVLSVIIIFVILLTLNKIEMWPVSAFIVGGSLVIATFIFTRKWERYDSILYKIQRQPIIPAKFCTPGTPAQVYGKIVAKEPLLNSPFTKTPCVFYHYIEEKYVQSGKHSYWRVDVNKMNYVHFEVIDKSGSISVDLRNVDSVLGSHIKLAKQNKDLRFVDYDNSELDVHETAKMQNFNRPTQFLFLKVSELCRASEYVLKEGDMVFVNGWVYEENGKKFIAESAEMPLIVSIKDKEKYLEEFAKGDNFFYQSNLLLLLGSILIFWLANHFFGLPMIYFGVALAIILARVVYTSYNRFVTLEKRCENASSQIMIELKKRNDLLPELAKAVGRYAKYERDVQDLVTKLRIQLGERLIKENLLEYMEKEGLLKDLIISVENYPDLKASEVFLDLQGRIVAIEENIAYFRGFYNKTVLKYNTLVQQFPFVIIAKLFGFKEKEFYKF